MNKIYLVAKRELMENLRTKGFWIGIFLFPIMLGVMMIVPELLDRTKSARQYAILDNSGWLADAVSQRNQAADLAIAFRKAVEKFDADELSDLPPLLAELAPALAELQPAELGLAATVIALPSQRGDTEYPAALNSVLTRGPEIIAWLAGLSSDEAKNFSSRLSKARFNLVDTEERSEEELIQMILDDELFAYIVLTQDPVAGTGVSRYVSNNLTDDDLQNWFRRTATGVVREKRLEQENIDPAVAGWIQRPLQFESEKIGDSGEVEEVSKTDMLRQWAPVAFVYLLFFSIFMASQMLLTNTIEEKSNRIIEVLLSSVSPIQLMVGKISGIAASGLILVGSWMAMFFLGTKYLPRLLGAAPSFDLSVLATDPTYVVSFVVYFLLGYLLYASLFVAIGSIVNTLKEAQNLVGPITLLLIVPLIVMAPIARDPNGTLAKVMSYIPLFTPFTMMNRAAGPPTLFEYITTSILLVISVGVAMWAAAKVFRVGVLMTGKPPTIREIFRWIKAPVGAVPDRGD